MENPAVSVIIPMYNAEKYIGECLDSLFLQMFEDFEVIAVDDCSTDKSAEIVKSYMPRFNGRLILNKTEKNSGSGALPRNAGLKQAKGEYVFFMDADDLVTQDALEELYSTAKEYDADLVYIEKYYEGSDLDKMNLRGINTGGFVEKPTFESENLFERLNALLRGRFGTTPWIKFTKRNLLIDNELFFPDVKIGEDDIWTYASIFYAKKLLRVPNAVYLHRLSDNSVTGTKRTPKQNVNFWINPLILGLSSLDKLMENHEFFKSNPAYRYSVLEFFVNAVFRNVVRKIPVIPSTDFYSSVKEAFGEKLGDYNVLIPALCAVLYDKKINLDMDELVINEFKKNFATIDTGKQQITNNSQQIVDRFKKYFTARVDIKLVPKGEGDFQILNMSDDKAVILKPAWFNKDGIGYEIHSFVGNLEFIAKATVDGQILLYLRGIWVQNPEDKSKRVPYWVDYTKLIVNGKTVFDKLTPAWHDKLFRHIIDVKAGEEIKIQIEWLPHRSDT